MTFTFALEKVMAVREREAVERQHNYNQAVHRFEEVGYELYKKLKERETIDSNQLANCAEGTTIADIQEKQKTRKSLEHTIVQYQQKMDEARETMKQREEEMRTAAVELKKYEKMKRRKWEQYITEQKQKEQQLMDELASLPAVGIHE